MAFFKKTIRDVPLTGKTVLLRVDYNVPLAEDGSISDDLRIRASLPTINYLLERGCRVVIISHLGRPKGAEKKYSLEPVAEHLQSLLGHPVRFCDATVGDKAYQTVKQSPKAGVVMFENLRFYDDEEQNDEAFAKKIAKASMASYFVQDGFGVVHRAHASTDAITHFLPAVSGLLLEKEYATITKAVEAPKRPLVAVVGGAKVSDKIGIIERFTAIADTIVIGGAMANTFLANKGCNMASSILEDGCDEVLESIYAAAKKKTNNVDEFIQLPSDVAVAKEITAEQSRREVVVDALQAGDIALDIGEKSIDRMIGAIERAGTVIWNGTLGYATLPEFAHGSARLALALATHPNITSVIGGGDTADFVLKWDGHEGKSFTHVSTGGGASLDLIAGKKLPGVEALLDAH